MSVPVSLEIKKLKTNLKPVFFFQNLIFISSTFCNISPQLELSGLQIGNTICQKLAQRRFKSTRQHFSVFTRDMSGTSHRVLQTGAVQCQCVSVVFVDSGFVKAQVIGSQRFKTGENDFTDFGDC